MFNMEFNRNMSKEELEEMQENFRQDFRFYSKTYHVLVKNHGIKCKLAKKVLELMNISEKRYNCVSQLLLNR